MSFTTSAARWLSSMAPNEPSTCRKRRLPQARMRIRAFYIITDYSPSRCKPPARPLPRPPHCHHLRARPRRLPIPLQTTSRRRNRPSGRQPIDQACLDRLSAAGIEFEQVTFPPAVNPECAIATPVRLKAVKLPQRWRTSIRLPEEPTLSCQFGERFGHWLRDLVAPLIAGELAVELKSVHTGPGYECRNRNHADTGKISAHASGLAVDVASFELANGETLPIKPNGDEHLRGTVDAIRVAACGWFTTVLGPGSDAAHAEHLHVDILQHGSSDRYRICP